MLWKRVFCFENRLSGVKKKQTVRCFTKYTPKNQIELNRIEAICIVVVVLLIFTLSFLIILFFMLFHLIFLPLTFSGMHVCTMHTGSYPHASSGNVLFPKLNNLIYVTSIFRLCLQLSISVAF